MAIKIGKKNSSLTDEEWDEKFGDKFSLEPDNAEESDDDDLLEEELAFDESDFEFEADTLSVKKSIIKPTVSPKETLITMLRESQFEEPYTIELNATYKEAKSFIHRMRVELSRFRSKLIKLNKTLDRFSILTQSITVESKDYCTITLIKTRHRRRFDNADPEVLSVLNFLSNESENKQD